MGIEFPLPLSQLPPQGANTSSLELEQGPSTFHRMLLSVGTEVDRGERLMQGVVSGRDGPMGAAELIALQAGIYRYIEVVDLTSKFVDRAASAVRTTLQSGG